MLLTVLIGVALWTFLSAVVVGCCVSASAGDGAGWNSARQAVVPGRVLGSKRSSRAARRARHVA